MIVLTREPSRIAQYAFAVVAVAVAAVLRFALTPVLGEGVGFILFYPAVFLCAWYGGLWSGLLSVALSALVAWFVFVPPFFSFAFPDPATAAQLIVFILASALICALAESRHRQRRKTEESERREREAHERLRVTMASIGDGVITTDVAGRVSFMNEIAQNLTGWTFDDAVRRPLGDVFRIVDEQTHSVIANPALRAMREGVIIGLGNHTLLIAKDGTEVPIDDSGAPIRDTGGEVLGAVLVFREITERGRADAKFRLAIEAAPNAMLIVDRKGTISLVNAQAESLFGYSREELVGQPVELLVPQRFREQHPAHRIGFVAAPQKRWIGAGRDLYGLRKDGSEVPIEIGLTPLEIEGETLVLSSIVDITERKLAEQSLLEGARLQNALYRFVARLHRSESLYEIYEAAVDSMLDALRCDRASILLRDEAGVMRFVAWRDLSDSYRRALEGHSPWAADEPNPQPVCMPDIATELMSDVVRKRIIDEGIRALAFIPLVMNGKLAGKFMTYYNVPHAFSDLELRLSLSIARQLAIGIERKHAERTLRTSEQRLRLALDAGQMGSWEWNVRSGQVTWSPEIEAIHGLEPGTFVGTFAAYRKDIHPDDWEEVQRSICRTPEQGEHHVEYRVVRADGSIRWVEERGKVFGDGSGMPTRVIGVCSDITERKRALEALKQADRRKDEFLATLAHELRNPLAPIRNGVEILRRVGPGEPQFDDVRSMMERQVRQMTRLLDDLLDVSRITRNKITLRKEPVELASVLALAVEISRPLIDRRRHELTVSLPTEPVPLQADPARLAQTFANLLNNAAKYGGEKNRIELSATREGDQVVVRVRDYGIGIAAHMLPRIFDMFAQAEDAQQQPEAGLGIGLTLVRALVTMHRGTVQAFSAGVGKGSEFVVRLPVSTEQHASDTNRRSSPSARQIRRQTLVPALPRRVLMVDDNKDAVTSLATLLTMQGYDVRTASDAPTALNVASTYLPDIVLLDIGLPGTSGYEVARQIRAMPSLKNVLLVAMTGYGQENDKLRSEQAGFNAHLVKPVGLDVLTALFAHPTALPPRTRPEELPDEATQPPHHA